MTKITDPIKINSMELPHRMVVAPNGKGYAYNDGTPSERLIHEQGRLFAIHLPLGGWAARASPCRPGRYTPRPTIAFGFSGGWASSQRSRERLSLGQAEIQLPQPMQYSRITLTPSPSLSRASI